MSSAFVYRVKITFLYQGNTSHVMGEYNALFDAISVAKGMDIDEHISVSRPALTNEQFNEKFFELLTNGYTYTGNKSPTYPDGNVVIHLVKVDPVYNEEMAVYGDKPMYNVLPAIPQQQSQFIVYYRDESSRRQSMSFGTKSEAVAFIKAHYDSVISTNFQYNALV